MKKTFNIIITLVALLAFTPIMRAQDPTPAPIPFPADPNITFSQDEWNKEYTIDTYSKVAYRKIISQPNSKGIYHILLDAFVTGREVKIEKSLPADIILVLDVSGSMAYNMSGSQTSRVPEQQQRLYALKQAVKNFIDLIDQNDLENAPNGKERLGNRIAIVPFSAQLRNNGQNQVRGFEYLSRASVMKGWIDNLYADSSTYTDLGMERAFQMLKQSNSQLKTVVLFTDGLPGYYGSWTQAGANYRESTWQHANATIAQADSIKNLAVASPDPDVAVISNVFTISIITGSESYTDVYLGKTSSNYLGATNMGTYATWNNSDPFSNGNGTRNTSSTNFALTANSAEGLKEAFATIAESSGGSSEGLGSATVAAVDVVSASFVLPPNSDESSIKVYTSKCINVPSNGQPVFGPDTLATQRKDKYQPMRKNEEGILIPDGDPKDVDNDITVTLKTSAISGKKDSITVNGFDYSNNWCGEVVENEEHVGWHGNKVTILIPIKMNPDALGGVGVKTNGDGSGIYIDGKNEFPFESPKVNLPVNIIINKQGLDVGESSKFTIYKSIDKTTWNPVTSVFVTRHSGQGSNEPRTRIEGLPATDANNNEYIYKVVEDNWSWSYTLTSDRELLTDDNDNPFVYTNEKKNRIDTKIRHAESKATNTFKTGGGDQYDDSKGNGRTVITVTTGTN